MSFAVYSYIPTSPTTYSTDSALGSVTANDSLRAGQAGSFAAALAAASQRNTSSQSTGNGSSTSSDHSSELATRAQEKASKHAALLQEFNDYMKKSPAERMREAILRQMNLTEDDLKAMPKEERQAVEKAINQRIREHLLGHKPEEEAAAGSDDLAATPVGAASAMADVLAQDASNTPVGAASKA